MKFPVIIKDGKSVITFTDSENGTYENGNKCASSLTDYMVRVEFGSAEIINCDQPTEVVSLIKELIAAFTFEDGVAFGKKWGYEVYQDIAFRLFNAGYNKESDALYFAWEETTDNGEDFVKRLELLIA